MTLDEERSYQDMFAMYATPGWKALIASADDTAGYLENARLIRSEAELFAAQGKLFILDWLRRHEEAMRLQYQVSKAQEEADAESI